MSSRQKGFNATYKDSGRRFEESSIKEERQVSKSKGEDDVNSDDHDTIVRLNENVLGLRNEIKDIKDSLDGKVVDHETRLRSNEKDINYAKGGLKVLYAIAGLLATSQVLILFFK